MPTLSNLCECTIDIHQFILQFLIATPAIDTQRILTMKILLASCQLKIDSLHEIDVREMDFSPDTKTFNTQ